MQGLYKEYSDRPETANLLKAKTEFKNDSFYDAIIGNKGKQEVLRIDEENEQSSENDTEKQRIRDEEEKAKMELKKQIEKLQNQNETLKKDIKIISKEKGTGC
jgi:cell division protein FtsB